jgi:hypothetical protein
MIYLDKIKIYNKYCNHILKLNQMDQKNEC